MLWLPLLGFMRRNGCRLLNLNRFQVPNELLPFKLLIYQIRQYLQLSELIHLLFCVMWMLQSLLLQNELTRTVVRNEHLFKREVYPV